jgi:hypothetical protein
MTPDSLTRGPAFRSRAELDAALAAGGRLVVFEYCVSLIVITLRRPSRIYYLRPGRRGWWRGLPYTLLSAALGWWGLPWGPIFTPIVLVGNLGGGCDVTAQVTTRRAHLPDEGGPP